MDLTTEERKFCELYTATTDLAYSVQEARIPVGMRNYKTVGEELLKKVAVKDYLLMLSDAHDQESVIRRLGIIRKEAWKKGDIKQAAAMEMNIADISGLKVIKTQNVNVNLDKNNLGELSNGQLIDLLGSDGAKNELKKQGLKLVDGRLDRDDGSNLYSSNSISDAEFEEIDE